MKPEFEKMLASMGDPRFSTLAETLETTSPEVSVRLNPYKAGDQTAIAKAADGNVGWWEKGRYLPTRPRFTSDPVSYTHLTLPTNSRV